MRLTETAYAKINLALHVRRRRDDGYHDIETLFAFVDAGDRLTAVGTAQDSLQVIGEFGAQLADPFGNIVAHALSVLPRPDGLTLTLEKNLPVAAGLGGGSADAGAVFRMVRDAYGLPDDWRDRAAHLGADVPACVESRACIGLGTGTDLAPVENDLAGKPVLLVNPRLPVATGPVFAAWDGKDRGPLPTGLASRIAAGGRNDLEAPARAICPAVGDVLAAMGNTGASLVRMSGSGATCFALYNDDRIMQKASENIEKQFPEWWRMTGHLR